MSSRLAVLAERKALLVTRAQLDRTRLSLAVRQVRSIVRPTPDAVRRAGARPTAAMLVGLAVPLLGMRRLGRWLRFTSFAITAYRVIRNWRAAS
jgi:MFS superfamily sulfate permease-like transporter